MPAKNNQSPPPHTHRTEYGKYIHCRVFMYSCTVSHKPYMYRHYTILTYQHLLNMHSYITVHTHACTHLHSHIVLHCNTYNVHSISTKSYSCTYKYRAVRYHTVYVRVHNVHVHACTSTYQTGFTSVRGIYVHLHLHCVIGQLINIPECSYMYIGCLTVLFQSNVHHNIYHHYIYTTHNQPAVSDKNTSSS